MVMGTYKEKRSNVEEVLSTSGLERMDTQTTYKFYATIASGSRGMRMASIVVVQTRSEVYKKPKPATSRLRSVTVSQASMTHLHIRAYNPK